MAEIKRFGVSGGVAWVCGSVFGLVGVGLGAFGAHGLAARLEAAGSVSTWETAVFYQLVHAVALLAVGSRGVPLPGWIGGCWVAGVLCFSGSLYALALGAPGAVFGPVTPIGGVLFLVGWAGALLAGRRA